MKALLAAAPFLDAGTTVIALPLVLLLFAALAVVVAVVGLHRRALRKMSYWEARVCSRSRASAPGEEASAPPAEPGGAEEPGTLCPSCGLDRSALPGEGDCPFCGASG